MEVIECRRGQLHLEVAYALLTSCSGKEAAWGD